MTNAQVKQMIKNEAINSIAKLFHPLHKFHYDNYSEDSRDEQKFSEIKSIVESMNRKLSELKKANQLNK